MLILLVVARAQTIEVIIAPLDSCETTLSEDKTASLYRDTVPILPLINYIKQIPLDAINLLIKASIALLSILNSLWYHFRRENGS